MPQFAPAWKIALSPIFQSSQEFVGDGIPFLAAESNRSGKPLGLCLVDSLWCAVRHGTTLSEYSRYRLADRPASDRSEFVGARVHYRFLGAMNDPEFDDLLEDKFRFHEHFAELTGRLWMRTEELGSGGEVERAILSEGRFVAKPRFGKRGQDVMVIHVAGWNPTQLRRELLKRNLELIESFVVQHPAMAALSNSGVNTLRVITQNEQDRVDVLGARMRVSNGGYVDNGSQGGLITRVDPHAGTLVGDAFVLDPRVLQFSTHPRTGTRFDGYEVPFWEDVLELSRSAARLVPHTRSVGWDIAITAEGPLLIEGNHRWMRQLWQMGEPRGLRPVLQEYARC